MSELGFLRFEPYFKQVLWGGQRLRPFKGLEPDDNPIGESWEISGLEGYESVVSNGQFKGKRIDTLLKEYGNDILGERLYRLFGNKFPLLIKFIDAAKDLSIQVHPDDRIAKRRHKCWGKTELWYTLDPQGDAYLYSGLLESITPEQLKQHIEQNTLSNVLAKFYPSRGDLFYLPAGRIHSIGAGNLILEIQQTSDITYRVYDYDRTDKDGKKRELHTDLAVDAIDYRVHEDYMRHISPKSDREIVMKECPFFTATLLSLTRSHRVKISRYDSFRIVIATAGKGQIVNDTCNVVDIRQGETILIPATTKWIDIRPEAENLEIVTAYIQ